MAAQEWKTYIGSWASGVFNDKAIPKEHKIKKSIVNAVKPGETAKLVAELAKFDAALAAFSKTNVLEERQKLSAAMDFAAEGMAVEYDQFVKALQKLNPSGNDFSNAFAGHLKSLASSFNDKILKPVKAHCDTAHKAIATLKAGAPARPAAGPPPRPAAAPGGH